MHEYKKLLRARFPCKTRRFLFVRSPTSTRMFETRNCKLVFFIISSSILRAHNIIKTRHVVRIFLYAVSGQCRVQRKKKTRNVRDPSSSSSARRFTFVSSLRPRPVSVFFGRRGGVRKNSRGVPVVSQSMSRETVSVETAVKAAGPRRASRRTARTFSAAEADDLASGIPR